jgi:hypothetical protein
MTGRVGGCPIQQARANPTSTHLYVYDCSLKSISSIYIYIYMDNNKERISNMSLLWCPRIQGYLDTYKYCILRSSPLPQLYNKHPLLAQELLAGFSSSYCRTFLFQQAVYMRNNMLNLPLDDPIMAVYCNNQSTLKIIAKPPYSYHSRMKHLSIKEGFIYDNVKSGQVNMIYVPTTDNFVDFLTKLSLLSSSVAKKSSST